MRRGTRVLTEGDISRVVEMAWEDRTSFEAIEAQFGLDESAVIALMRAQMKPSSFRMCESAWQAEPQNTRHCAELRTCATAPATPGSNPGKSR